MKRLVHPLAAVLLTVPLSITSTASAQEQSAFVKAFSGQWETLSHNFSADEARPCAISLQPTQRGSSEGDGNLTAETTNCSRELDDVVSWSIQSGQIALRDRANEITALLGGNQRRLNGRTATRNAIALLRRDGPFASTTLDCVYLGYTASCASRLEQAAPRVENNTEVTVLARTNLRQRPSASADAMQVIPPNTCVPIDECMAGSDGIWCKARYQATEGWVKKTAMRLDRYPIVTFSNRC